MTNIIMGLYFIPMINGTGLISEMGKEHEDRQYMHNGSDSKIGRYGMEPVEL